VSRRGAARVALLAAVGLALAASWQVGLFELLTRPEQTAEALRELGAWGYALYVVSFALLAAFGVPGIAFVLPAAMIWPRWIALALSVAGATGAACVGFGFARFLARDWVVARIPARLRRRVAALESRPVRTVVVVRLLFVLLPPSHWVLGVSGVGFGAYVWGSLLGYLPSMAVLTWVGGGVMEWMLEQPPETWRLAAAAVGAVLLLNWVNARRRRAVAGV